MEKEVLVTILKKKWKETSVAQIISLSTSPTVDAYRNFMSEVRRLELKVLLGNGKTVSRSVILKDATQGANKFRDRYDVFMIEVKMYETVLKEMEHLMNDFEDTDDVLWCKLLHHVPNRCILLEDLKPQGFSMVDKTVYFDLEHSLLACHSLGRYHGMSKVLEERGILTRDGYKPWYAVNDSGVHRQWTWKTHAFILEVKTNWGPEWRSIADRIKLDPETLHEKLKKTGEIDENKFNLLNHGDLNRNNIMFKYGWENRPIAIRFLDFQMAHYGSPCCDLTYLMYVCISPLVRREHFTRLLDVYHQSLLRTLAKFQFSGNKPGIEEIADGMEKLSFSGLHMCLFGFFFLNFDFEKVRISEGKEGCDSDLYKIKYMKKTFGPDLKTYAEKFF